MKVKVCQVGEIPPDGLVSFDVEGEKVCIANANGELYAIADTCTHAEASLSEGYLHVDDCTVECPLHNAVFSLRDGEALEFPAEEPVKSYPLTVEDDDVYIEVAGD